MKAMGGAPLLELIDFCMCKIMRLYYRPRDEVEKVLFVPAMELAAQMGTFRKVPKPHIHLWLGSNGHTAASWKPVNVP